MLLWHAAAFNGWLGVHPVAYQLPAAPILCIAGCCTVVQQLEDVKRKVRDQPVVVRTEIQAR
jgi:hypothetical protein